MGETVVAGGTDLHVGPENLNFTFTAVGSSGGGGAGSECFRSLGGRVGSGL